MIDSLSKLASQSCAFSLTENGKSLSLIASSVTPFILKVAHTLRKVNIKAYGSSLYRPPNGLFYTIWMILGLISKLLLAMVGATIPPKLLKMSSMAKSPNVLLSSSAILFNSHWFTLLCICFLRKVGKVNSTSGSK